MSPPRTARFPILLLDFGGVCIPHPFEIPDLMATTFGLRPDQLPWAGPAAPQADPLWVRQQAGEITEREYWAHHAATVGRLVDGRDWTLVEFMRRFHETVDGAALIRPQAWRLLDAADAAGVQVAVLTNDLRYFAGDHFADTNPFLARCTPVVDGSVTGVLKPDPRAYAIALEALGGPPPERVLFVDDQAANTAAAATAGLGALHFQLTDAARSWWSVAEALFSADADEAIFGAPLSG